MPIVDNDAAQKAAAAAEKRDQRRAARKAELPQEGAVSLDKGEAIPESKMLGLPEGVLINGLYLVLVCPKIKDAFGLQEKIYQTWPDILLFAATGDMQGTGVNTDAVLDLWNANRKAVARISGAPEPEPMTRADVRSQMAGLSMSMKSLLPALCDTIWEMASTTDNLHWPKKIVAADDEGELIELPEGEFWLDDAIMEHCSIPDLADILRAMLACMGGYPGDAATRFP